MDTLIDSLPGNILTIARVLGAVIGAYLFLIWIASLFWAWRDMRSRTRDFVTRLAGLSVMLFLPLIGYPVYLAVRPALTLREAYDRELEQEAILSELQAAPTCPECRRPIDADWMICAFCSYVLKQPCPGCDRLLMNSWRHCPYCAMPREQPEAPELAEEPAVEEESAPIEQQPTRRRRRAARAAAATGMIQPVTRPPRPDFQADAEREPAPETVGGSRSSQG